MISHKLSLPGREAVVEWLLDEEVGKGSVELYRHCVLDWSKRIVKSNLYTIRLSHSGNLTSYRNSSNVCHVNLQIICQIVSKNEGRLLLGEDPLPYSNPDIGC